MRKILISIIVCLLLIGSTFLMVNGIGKLKIEGIKGLDEKNSQLNQKISDLSNTISVTYTNTESNLKHAADTLATSKTEYENQAALSDTENPSYVSNLETYDIDFLWTKLGNYAREENVIIKLELVTAGTVSNVYNLNFTVTGSYVNTTNFIYDIENDSKLGFKIDEFKMGVDGDNSLVSTFVCKEVPVNVGTLDKGTGSDTTTEQGSTNSTENASSASSSSAASNTTASNTAASDATASKSPASNATNPTANGSASNSAGASSTSATDMLGTNYAN